MELQNKDYVFIQSYKHDGRLHRTWAKGYVLEVTDKRIVAVTNKTLVSESNGRKWITREPAICFFYPNKWYNVICMIRKTGIQYYCNIASPSIFDTEAIKNIDYDLDVKVSPQERRYYWMRMNIYNMRRKWDIVLNWRERYNVAWID